MNEQDAEMVQQINQFLDAISPPDPDGMYSVAKVDGSADPVELYRQGLAMGSGHVWYVGTEKVATAITGNGPKAKANAEFYAAAPVFIRWLLDQLANADAEIFALQKKMMTVGIYAHYFYMEALRLRIDGNMVDTPMSFGEWFAGAMEDMQDEEAM